MIIHSSSCSRHEHKLNILLFHGVKNTSNDAFLKGFCESLKLQVPSCSFVICSLSQTNLNLYDILSEAFSRGYSSIKVIPMLLMPGYHFYSDIQKVINRFKAEHPKYSILLENSLIQDPDFIKYTAKKIS